MSLRDELLTPIAGANPGGVDLRYDPLYDKIKEARREDDDAPQGEWTTARKVADWPTVIKLAKDALADEIEGPADRRVAHRGAASPRGLRRTLAPVSTCSSGLVDQHWDHLFPEIDDGDAEMRAAPLEWVGLKLDFPVRMRAARQARAHDSVAATRSRALVPTEAAAAETRAKAATRASGDRERQDDARGDRQRRSTPRRSRGSRRWSPTSTASLAALEEARRSRRRRSSATPRRATRGLRDALERRAARRGVSSSSDKLELEPDPVDVTAGAGVATRADVVPPASAAPAAGRSPPSRRRATTRRRASSAPRVSARATIRSIPASYLCCAASAGVSCARSGALDPKLLEAPPTSVRTTLKGLLLDSRWPELLEACEGVMGTPQGRGWLDLQRYALTACDALGSDYFAVATAMRGALRVAARRPAAAARHDADGRHADGERRDARLAARRDLPARRRALAAPRRDGPTAAAGGRAASRGRAIRSRSPTAEVRAGRADRAIALLMREASREKTSRGRFLVQAQLARIMVDAGHEAVAMPILEQLIADVETHKLEEWEAGELVAAPMALLYRVLDEDRQATSRRARVSISASAGSIRFRRSASRSPDPWPSARSSGPFSRRCSTG